MILLISGGSCFSGTPGVNLWAQEGTHHKVHPLAPVRRANEVTALEATIASKEVICRCWRGQVRGPDLGPVWWVRRAV